MPEFVKRRGLPAPGSIPDTLDIFRSEVRFYREVAAEAGVRVPACYTAEISDAGTLLVLEDLSTWRAGAEPESAAQVLAAMHARWSGRALERWPWLRPVGAAAGQVEALYRDTWPVLAAREDLTRPVRDLAARLLGNVVACESALGASGPLTLAHGDASLANMRTSPEAEIALLDWEDVSSAPGIADLAWLLVSSVEAARWPGVITAYGAAAGLADVLPAAAVQGLLELSDTPDGSSDGSAWLARLTAAQAYISA
ncbi:MAG TPA: aminoglycoside phosphotransferase family protein [Streptosporangiaceae bacterium]|nr:aminoglycoside phosphotransferase family protein [Streptosporangiaceae bacterium]